MLVGRGLHEIAGWSFASPELLERLRLPADSPLRRVVPLENPMAADEAILRPTLLGSLLQAARHNLDRGAERVALFERGTVYRADPRGRLADEHDALAVALVGPLAPATWRTPAPPDADVFAAKALLAAVLDALRVDWSVLPGGDPFLHPGRAASVRVAGERVGFLGELHPLVARAWELERVAVFALDLDRVLPGAPEVVAYEDVTSFPAVRQDLAVVVGPEVSAAAVVALVRESGGGLLRAAEVFDRYELGPEQVSLALHLEFAAGDRTLTDEQVAGLRERIVARLRDELGAEPRG